MTRLFQIHASILAISSVASAFTSLTVSSSLHSVVRRPQPLHMSLSSSFGDWDLPEEIPNGHEDTSLLEALPFEKPKFANGDDLQRLRRTVLGLRAELHDAKAIRDSARILELQRLIVRAQQLDAEFVYSVALERMENAEARGQWTEADKYRREAAEARKALPQFNLEGLWVGKYGDHGYEMINITYVGDTILAFKVTGDQNVPKGELSFSVDLSPMSENKPFLEPVELGDAAARQWGAKYLSRFSGKGQVAGVGYTNAQFIEGQLILVNDFFSFAWVPIGHQVFFGRPTADLTLKLLRESQQGKTEMDKARAHLTRCMEETEHLHDEEIEDIPTALVAQQESNYYGMQGCFD